VQGGVCDKLGDKRRITDAIGFRITIQPFTFYGAIYLAIYTFYSPSRRHWQQTWSRVDRVLQGCMCILMRMRLVRSLITITLCQQSDSLLRCEILGTRNPKLVFDKTNFYFWVTTTTEVLHAGPRSHATFFFRENLPNGLYMFTFNLIYMLSKSYLIRSYLIVDFITI
jgi:hypothetical protein